MTNFDALPEDLKSSLKDKTLLSGKELIALGIVRSESTLSRWRRSGEGPPCLKLTKGKHLYAVTDLIRWLESSYINRPQSIPSQINPYTFTSTAQRQLFYHTTDSLPPRPTVDDLERNGEFGSKTIIIQGIANGTGPQFTCDRNEAAYIATQAYEPPLTRQDYICDPENGNENNVMDSK